MNPSLEVINPGTEDLITQTQGQCTVNTTTDSNQKRKQPMAVGIATHVQVASRTSPANSPFKQTRSPAPKIRRRMRTGTDLLDTTEREPLRDSDCSFVTNRRPTYGTTVKTLSDFTQSQGEETAMTELQEELNAYIVQKHIIREQNPDNTRLS